MIKQRLLFLQTPVQLIKVDLYDNLLNLISLRWVDESVMEIIETLNSTLCDRNVLGKKNSLFFGACTSNNKTTNTQYICSAPYFVLLGYW